MRSTLSSGTPPGPAPSTARSRGVQAYVTDSTVGAGTDVKVAALDDSQVDATVRNAADTTASGLYGNSGKGLGAVLATTR